ncbi:unnamed protein product [Symbiodinium sp. CCMP2592]|nr:unnamed protein product [Symbiodinium sp. CCMP2592]
MARVFMCATALLASVCFVVPRPEHPRFQVNQLRFRKTDRQCKQTALASATLCLSLSLVTGVSTYTWQARNKCRAPLRQCRLRSIDDESMLLLAEARRLRAEAANLEQEQLRAKELMMVRGGLELVQHQPDWPQPMTAPALKALTHVKPRVQRETKPPRSAQPEPHVKPVEDFEYEIPVMDHSLRLLATLPYLLPAIDAWRFFGVGIAFEAWPALYMEWTSLATEVPEDFPCIFAALYPVLLFGMPLIAVRRWLPELLRVNLNQAFLFSGILCLAFHLSAFSRWLAFLCAGDDALYVPAAAEPPLMPGGHVLLPLMAACIVYSIYCTLCRGTFPDKIPFISAEARRSLGTSPTALRSKSCSNFLERKSRSHRILPGAHRDDAD